MQLILLASNPKLYSNQKLLSSASSLGHKIFFVNIADCYLTIKNNQLDILSSVAQQKSISGIIIEL